MKRSWKRLEDGIFEGRKTVEMDDISFKKEADGDYIFGYANTKGKADAYGDIPMSLGGKSVYDLTRFKKNPVALVDHQNSVSNIFGAYVFGGEDGTMEDEKGLRIKLKLMENPQTDTARHAVEAYKSGFARAFSIGGKWIYGDKQNPAHLTTAIIHEISGVAIPADQYALSTTSKVKSGEEIDEVTKAQLAVMETLIEEFSRTKNHKILIKIKQLKESFK